MSSVHNIPHSPTPQPAKKLRPSLSPARGCLRPSSPPVEFDASSRTSSARSSFSDGSDYRRCKTVHWQGEVDGCVVTKCFDTYSASEYDRTPLAPPSEQERSCVLPARGARCLSYMDDDEDDDESDHDEEMAEASDSDDDTRPSSPFASPEDSDLSGVEDDGDEWSACFARRRMMFARMSSLDRESAQPQFEGYRSLSATLVELLKSVGCDEDDDTTTLSSTPGSSADEGGMSKLSSVSSNESIATVVFSRLREERPEDDERETEPEIDTPSLISSADSEAECSIASPPCSRVEFVPPPIMWTRTALTYGPQE